MISKNTWVKHIILNCVSFFTVTTILSILGISGTPLCVKRRMFFLMVYGVVPEEPYTILKITQESTTQDVLTLCLQKANINPIQLNDYILVEEVARGWEKKDHNLPATQRILDFHERPLQVKLCIHWNFSYYLI